MREASETGRIVAIVNNNSGAAIRAYLQLHDLRADVTMWIHDSPGAPDETTHHHEPLPAVSQCWLGSDGRSGQEPWRRPCRARATL